MCICIYVYIYMYTCVYIYIYIYITAGACRRSDETFSTCPRTLGPLKQHLI